MANRIIWVRALHHDTISKIAMRRGHPELASEIARMNGIRSITKKLRLGRLIKIPGALQQDMMFTAHAQDGRRPKIVDGYAVFQDIQRPATESLNHFTGYNSLKMDVPITFEGFMSTGPGRKYNLSYEDAVTVSELTNILAGRPIPKPVAASTSAGPVIMDKIAVLERMAGRGNYKGARVGPPAVIRVSVTDNSGNILPLVPFNYQWSPSNPTAPLWRVVGIDWSDASNSDDAGYVVRQDATIHLGKYTPLSVAQSLTQRARLTG